LLLPQSKFANTLKMCVQKQKGAANKWPPLLETGITPRRLGHLTRTIIGAFQQTFEVAAELEYVHHAE
jgi:hypothetical protein